LGDFTHISTLVLILPGQGVIPERRGALRPDRPCRLRKGASDWSAQGPQICVLCGLPERTWQPENDSAAALL